MGLNLNLNSYSLPAKPVSSRKEGAPADGAKDFQSELSSKSDQNKSSYESNYESKGLNEKPIGSPGPNFGMPQMTDAPTGAPISVERVIPQGPVESKDLNQQAANIQTDSLGRRVAWQQFLQKMKSELDISAEDIVAAFQSLTPEELAQPPEKNIEKLVSNLGLNPEQSQMAAQMFSTLLVKTGSRPLAQELKSSGRDINLSLMSQREQEQKRLNENLERMNQQFFVKNSPKAEPEQKQDESFSLAQASPASSTPASSSSGNVLKDMSPVSDAEGKNILQSLTKDASATDASTADPAVVEASQNTVAADQQAPANPLAAALQQAEAKTAKPVAATQSEDDLHAAVSKNDLKLVSSEGKDPNTSLINDQEGDLDQEMDMDLSAQSFGAEGVAVESGVDQVGFKEALETLTSGVATKGSSDHLSTEELIQKAQVMIRDGGGDVKVILQPEGLGEVAMKISVQGDKVNVEMITESDAAKKLLEKGMGDLKGQLLASNLQLESIKVDTASQMGQQLEQQYQDAQRQAASNFMEQFRQGNQDFRRSFVDMPGAKIYQSQTKAKAPVVEASASAKDSSRRLNLVA